MGEWKKVRLKDVLIEGSKERVDDTSKYQKLTIKLNFKGMEKSKVREKMADRRPFYIREKGEIVIGKQNYFNGSIAILPDELDGGICSNAIMSFKTKKEYNNKYIYYLLSDTNFINRRSYLANGTGQKELSEKDFLNFEVIIPNINEQEKIVHILENVDLIIKKYERLLKEKNQFIKSQFVEMINSTDYEIKTMRDMSELITKQTGFDYTNTIKKHLLQNKEKNSVPYIQTKFFTGKNFNYNTDYYVPDNIVRSYPKITLDKKCILLSIVGASIGNIGLFDGTTKSFLGGAICVAKLKDEYNTDFVFYYLMSKFGQNQIFKNIKGSGQATVTIEDIRKFEIKIPSKNIQNKIVNVLNLIDKQKFELKKIIENYKKLKKGLMQQLLTGKIKVRI